MKKLLNTLYIMTPESYLALENENVVVLNGDQKLGQVPLSALESIIYFGYKGASPSLMGLCSERQVNLCFYTPSGRFLARSSGRTQGNVLLRRQQFHIASDEVESCRIARNMILGKVHNARWILGRATRDHPQRVDVEKLKRNSSTIAGMLLEIAQCEDLESLRGMEGKAAVLYFQSIDELVLKNEEFFSFERRTRRPPTDPMNALLSFAYTLLEHACTAALEGVGLDPYVGFLHRDRPGRASLSLDLMEELRGPVAERFILTLINQQVITPKHFTRRENEAVLLTDDGRKAFLNQWQERKRDELRHPYLEEKIPWGLLPHTQALLLARRIRGDLDAYPPFLWK